MKIHFNLKSYSPSRAYEGTAFAVIWAREGGKGVGFEKPTHAPAEIKG